jgi:ubiquinone/menaquinone biosynthesis C-methylase UbiE
MTAPFLVPVIVPTTIFGPRNARDGQASAARMVPGSVTVMRDTDADWNAIADAHPFFGVLAAERFRDETMTAADIDVFYEWGRADVEKAVAPYRRLTGSEFAPQRALDFGCGVGRMTFAMRNYAGEVVGVDVAPRMLDVAREQALARNVTNVEFRSTLPDEPVDWVASMIVLQHIPPARGHAILEQLVALLKPGGWLSIQLTFFRDQRHVGEVTRDIADYRYDGESVELLTSNNDDVGSMSMYDYDLNKVYRTLFLAGIEEVMAKHTDDAGCHGAWIFGRKESSSD